MAYFSPKIEIINHFDKLINRVDVDFEESLEKYNDQQVLGEMIRYWDHTRDHFQNHKFIIDFFDEINDTFKQHQTLDLWSESTKVIDYLKLIRISSIEEFRKAQEETLEYYKLNSSRFKSQLNNDKNIEDLKSELYAEKFYFQVYFTQLTIKLCAFNLFTFVTDFYMSPSDIDLLEKLINGDREPFCTRVFDEKLILIGLLYKHFIENATSNFPNHMILVSKQEVLNIEEIRFSYDFIGVNLTSTSIIDLSNLDSLYLNDLEGAVFENRLKSVEIKIEGLKSMKNLSLRLHASEYYSFGIKNVYSLKYFGLKIFGTIDEQILTIFLDKLPTIEKLSLAGNFSNFNLDHLVNLKWLLLNGTINEDFNFELFKNLCNQLEKLSFTFKNDKESIATKLCDGHCFSNVQVLSMYKCNIKILKKEFIGQFPALLNLSIHDCNLEMIEDDAFSNIKQLICLNLSGNPFKTLEKRIFSKLINLEEFHLRNSKLVSIEKDMFSNMKNLRELNLCGNKFSEFDSETLKWLKSLEEFYL